ncbi:MAG: hypothetical protein QGF00_32115 [Planctomycetota bacterium]|nr:hypothetical protein [Planctomycetota bacterium]MDP7254289.1 hypothetical protein [Planctomycetota bacterium]
MSTVQKFFPAIITIAYLGASMPVLHLPHEAAWGVACLLRF